MSLMNRCLSFSALASVSLTSFAAGQLSAIDGMSQVDDPVLPLLQQQFVSTQFGDNDDSDPFSSNGSELCGISATVSDGLLYIFIPGNLETNYNKFDLFLDFDESAGQNVLRIDNPDVDFGGLNAMGGSVISGAPGLRFDDGFTADFYITIGMGVDGKGENPAIYANAAQILTDGGGVGLYLGSSIDNPNGFGGVLSDTGIELAVDNSNIAGVSGGTEAAPPDVADGVTTGIEILIPLAQVAPGYVAGSGMRLCAMINNSSHTFTSNQILGSLEAPSDNLGETRLVDFRAMPGCQFVAFDGDDTTYDCGCDDCNGGGGEPPVPNVIMDGFADGSYGAPLAVQDTQTGFGDASLGLADLCDGSELDALYGFIDEDRINILVAGNLESNYNKLHIFLDYTDGGQNRLRGDNPGTNFNGLNVMGDDGSDNGLQFDADFAPDLWFSADCGGDTTIGMNASLAQILTDGGGVGTFLGNAVVDGGLIQSLNGIQVALNNSNVSGVDAGSEISDGSGVSTGLEVSIPLQLLSGFVSGEDIKVCAFVTSSEYDFMSNQVLGGLGGAENPGQTNLVDFSLIEGDQFVVVGEGGGPVCTGDLDGDLIIGGADLTLLLGSWGSKSATADLDGDGIVTGADLTILLGFWGQSCD